MATKTICSFFKDNKCIESLEEHLNTMLYFYMLFFYNNDWNIYSSIRLKSIGYNYTSEELDLMARIMILFHDAGKLFYQHMKRNFPYHEVYSAIMVLSMGEQIGQFFRHDKERAIEAIVASIILHHISMNRLRRGFIDIIRRQNYSLERKLFQEYKDSFEKILFNHGFELKVTMSFLEPMRLKHMIFEIDRILRTRIILGDPRTSLYQLVLRLLRVLMITDNYAAAEIRGGTLRLFIRDLPSIKSIDQAKKVLIAFANQ